MGKVLRTKSVSLERRRENRLLAVISSHHVVLSTSPHSLHTTTPPPTCPLPYTLRDGLSPALIGSHLTLLSLHHPRVTVGHPLIHLPCLPTPLSPQPHVGGEGDRVHYDGSHPSYTFRYQHGQQSWCVWHTNRDWSWTSTCDEAGLRDEGAGPVRTQRAGPPSTPSHSA